MKTSALLLAGLLALTGTASLAQPADQPDMGRLFEKVNAVAAQLQENLSGLEANIQASRDSIEKGGAVLDAMLESVKRVNASMAEDSEIWTELDALLELWEERRQETLEKSESNPAFQPIAQAWQSRLDTGRQLRNQISTERANSLALMRAIESDRDIVLAYYELGQADKAIESLQKVGANLTSLNENMQVIVKTASDAQRMPIAQ
jgi:tetratricopeptide (TPR) repeat protein